MQLKILAPHIVRGPLSSGAIENPSSSHSEGPSVFSGAIGNPSSSHSERVSFSDCSHWGGVLGGQASESRPSSGVLLQHLSCRIHIILSVKAEKIFGAERRPNGSALSINMPLFQETARSRWSDGCTGTALYSSLRSSFASRVHLYLDPGPELQHDLCWCRLLCTIPVR